MSCKTMNVVCPLHFSSVVCCGRDARGGRRWVVESVRCSGGSDVGGIRGDAGDADMWCCRCEMHAKVHSVHAEWCV